MNTAEVSNSLRPCYYVNSATKKLESGSYDAAAMMATIQQRADQLQKNPVGQNTLTQEEIQQLAKKYDPQNMTQKEYDSFIRYLEEKGVLSPLESSDIGASVCYVIPGFSQSAQIWTSSSSLGAEINTLGDVNGNALLFAQIMTKWEVPGSNLQIKQGAYAKVLDILGQMNTARASGASGQTALSSSSALMGDLSRFQLAIDHIKNKRIEL